MRVIQVGAVCDLSEHSGDDPRRCSFDVSEFVVLETGEHVTLHRDRGYSAWTNGPDTWSTATVDAITRDVLTTVLPDDAESSGEDHHWSWLVELARARGIDVSEENLRSLRYEVVISAAVLSRLDPPEPTRDSAN